MDKIVVPGLRDEFQLSPAVYYRRQKECFEGGAAAFEKESQCEVGRLQRELQATEE